MDSDMKTMQGIRSLMPSLSALTAALVLAGCASAPPTVDQHAGVAVPASFSAQAAAAGWTQAAPAEAQPRGAWWLVFADAELSALVERAGEANTDVQTAAARWPKRARCARPMPSGSRRSGLGRRCAPGRTEHRERPAARHPGHGRPELLLRSGSVRQAVAGQRSGTRGCQCTRACCRARA
jgi:hypothetical protein